MNDYLSTFIKTINKEVTNFKPDIIHCQHIWVAPFAASKTNVPYIITAHGTDIKGFKRDNRYHHIAIKAAEGAEKIITISKHINESVKKHYPVFDEKLRLILNGFDENIFYPRNLSKINVLNNYINKDLSKTENLKLINFTGKLADFKGVDLLLKAAEIYEKELANVVTLIIGDGELREELRNLKKELNLKSIYFLGNLPQETLAELYSIADITVVPSRVEPFGLVALESLACGTPVIASKAGGLTDFINNEVGSFFPMNDYEALASEIIDAINKNEKEQKGERASEYALNNYSWNRVIDELLEVYNEVIEGGKNK
jgi:glycosyltransferase involved in cell wall biosynthesis